MKDFFIKIYTEQIKDQLNEAERCFEEIKNNSSNSSTVFSATHHFLVHVSNVVKLIQPNIKDDNDFRKYRALSLKKTYPNLPTISPNEIHIRNDYEHYDERIDYWVINSKNHNYADKNIGPVTAIQGLDPKDSFRWFDDTKMTLYFCGREYRLNDLSDYIQKVKKAINE
jgi:hypothetical protein